MISDCVLVQQASNSHVALLNLTVTDHAAYCLAHGIDYWPVYGDVRTGKSHAFWAKIALVQKAIDAGYERIAWLDSDCYIARPDVDLRDAFPEDGIGFVPHEKGDWSAEGEGCYDHLNCGAFYLAAGVEGKRLFKCWNTRGKVPDHFWGDQNFLNRYAIPDYEALYRKPAPIKRLGYEWNAVPFEPFTHPDPIVAAWHGWHSDIYIRALAMEQYIQRNKLKRMVNGCGIDEAEQKAEYCSNVGNYDAALLFFERAQKLGGRHPGMYGEWGRVHSKLGRHEEAAERYADCLDQDPMFPGGIHSLASCYEYMGDYEANAQALKVARDRTPGWPPLEHNVSIQQLRDGNWTDGFDGMKWQYLTRGRIARCPEAEWYGHRCGTLFVASEQGIGDTLMLSRYIRAAAKSRFCKEPIIFEVQAPLVNLFRAQPWCEIAKIVEQRPENGVPYNYDEWCGTYTLPKILGVTMENTIGMPYIVAPPEKVDEWRPKINGPGMKIGFSWAGSQAHGNNAHRNAYAALFDGLIKLPGTSWYCLQRDIEISDEVKADNPDITFLGEELIDMADTAGVLANLDLVITIDSAILHLAGAMGLPVETWGLISKSSDWRWLTDREDTVWYDSVRLFRQTKLDDWEEVISRVKSSLEEKINDGKNDTGRDAAEGAVPQSDHGCSGELCSCA